MKATIDQDAVKVAYAAAMDDKNPVLKYVRIGDGKIAASDGYILAECGIITEPESGESMLIEANIILSAQKLFGNKTLVIETRDNEFALITSEPESGGMISTPLLLSKYPDYSQVIQKGKEAAEVILDINKLVRLYRIARLKEECGLSVKIRERASPVEFNIGKTRIFLMPILR